MLYEVITINRNDKSPYIVNFKNNYKESKIPFYAAIELFSFGMLSRFYSNLKNEDKKIIAKTGFNVGYTYFESWIQSIAFVRNICAHYGRLYNFKLIKPPNLYKEYSGIDNYRVFAVILCLKTLIDDKMLWQTFVDELNSLVELYSSSINLNYIGFVDDWYELLK